ncbi:hypothetical protein TNCV_3891891 [Trichonephila clavipes]|nr:hypothetical protein TNCV_3891891 [Trichonephila clavipes]
MRFNIRYSMKDVTLKFIKCTGIIPEGDIFQISPKEQFGIEKSVECGGPSPLELTRSSRNSVKSILSRDMFGIDIERKIRFLLLLAVKITGVCEVSIKEWYEGEVLKRIDLYRRCGSKEQVGPARVSSSSLARGSKLQEQLPLTSGVTYPPQSYPALWGKA